MSSGVDAKVDTVGTALARCRAALAAADIESPALEARLLLSAALGVTNEQIVGWPECPVAAEGGLRLAEFLRRRLAHEPMSHILGRREFWSLDFAVTADVLTPRPDSETLVAAVLEHVDDRHRALSLLDLGTGTGCLLLSLLSELPAAKGVGVDISEAALAVARRNAEALHLAARADFRSGDWVQSIGERFDIVIGNPPYIVSKDIAGLPAEVRCEPVLALDGGADGLAAYRAIAAKLGRVAAPNGLVALEIGEGQAPDVERILRTAGPGLNRWAAGPTSVALSDAFWRVRPAGKRFGLRPKYDLD